MEWVVETVLPHEVRRLSKQISNQQKEIEEKDAAIGLLNDDLQKREYENVALQAQKDVYQAELQKCQDTITHLETRYFLTRKILAKTTSLSYGNTHRLPMISFMTCHIILRGYNDVKGMLS